jgi:hypothetical protein
VGSREPDQAGREPRPLQTNRPVTHRRSAACQSQPNLHGRDDRAVRAGAAARYGDGDCGGRPARARCTQSGASRRALSGSKVRRRVPRLPIARSSLDLVCWLRRGSLLACNGKGAWRREIGMDALGWEPPRPWVSARVELPAGRTAVLHHRRPDPQTAVVEYPGPGRVPAHRRSRRHHPYSATASTAASERRMTPRMSRPTSSTTSRRGRCC